MSLTPPAKPILTGYLIVAASILLATFIHSRAPRYVMLESGAMLNQSDGSIYRYVDSDSGKSMYLVRRGPSHLSYGVWPTSNTRNEESSQ